jgi:hypothetical protein
MVAKYGPLPTWPPQLDPQQPQSRQSAELFLQSSELGLPHPLSRRRVCPPPTLWSGGGGHTRLRERGWGSPNSDKGTYTVVLYKCKCFVPETVKDCTIKLPKLARNQCLLSLSQSRFDKVHRVLIWDIRASHLRVKIDLYGPLSKFSTLAYWESSHLRKSVVWHLIDMVWQYYSPSPVHMISTCRRGA